MKRSYKINELPNEQIQAIMSLRFLVLRLATTAKLLRAQGSVCKRVRISIRTGMFNPEEAKFVNGLVVDLPYPTDDVRLLIKAAVDAVGRVYRPGFKFSNAEVMLLNLCLLGEYTDDLFAVSQPAEATRIMAVLDQINGRWGRGTLRTASVPSNPDWGCGGR